ncbi:hypothetical protein NXV73_06855 [Bacteroides salyersiae]|nr:hypothetical protein [Bacteroides salyersiae]
MNKDLQKKAIKEARKEAKKLTKEGFKTPVGKLPLDKQIENAWQKQAEMTPDGTPFWYVASSRAIGGNQSSAVLQATNAAKIDLAGQIQTKVSQLIEAKVANDDMGQGGSCQSFECGRCQQKCDFCYIGSCSAIGRSVQNIGQQECGSDGDIRIQYGSGQ